MKKKILLVSTLAVVMGFAAQAQNTYFTGLGRSIFSHDRMTDEVQPAAKQVASSGYTLYDFGFNAESQGLVRAGAIVRLRNEFGGFYADGASMEIRQVQIEGIISNRVKYEVGDVYLSQTPYTIWNFDESFIDFESQVFGVRRDIVNYENYFIRQNWRMQGFNLSSSFMFMNGVESLSIQVYGSRLLPSNSLDIPDRVLYGTRLGVVQSSAFKIGGNIVTVTDLAGTVVESGVDYTNIVTTSDFSYLYSKLDNIALMLEGEAGFSYASLRHDADGIDKTKDDYFFDIGVRMKSQKKHSSEYAISYRDVGPDFNSPAAQTRRIVEAGNALSIEAFPHFSDETTLRTITMLDRLSQETDLYNQSISTTLLPYLPQYNSAEPYGQATPNRTGVTAVYGFTDSSRNLRVSLRGLVLSEIFSEGDTVSRSLRSFTSVQGGVAYDVGSMLAKEKALIVKLGGAYENTQRDGDIPIDLQSVSVDVGVDVETIKNLHFLAGVKLLQAQGNESLPVRNRFNEVTSGLTYYNLDSNERLLGLGMRYNFANMVSFTTQYIHGAYTSNIPGEETLAFTTRQWFFTFNYSF